MNKLNVKQARFVEAYLSGMCAIDAAREAGYKDPENSAHLVKRRKVVQLAIEAAMGDLGIGSNEVLARLADHATGSIEDFINPETDQLDIQYARKRKALKRAKKIKQTKTYNKQGELEITTEVEMYDAQAAMVHIGRKFALFTDKSAADGTLTINIVRK